MKNIILAFIAFLPLFVVAQTAVKNDNLTLEAVEDYTTVQYKTINVQGINIAYREAGNPKNPTLVLLHGFPASSHQYRKVLSELLDQYYLVAPDYPGFGNSDFPSPDVYEYSFDNLAITIDAFLEKKGLKSYAILMQDFGAPVGFRIATAHPERVTAIITQNGNAYEEGLGPAWKDIRKLWANRTMETEKTLHAAFSLAGLEWQYTHGTRNPENINPDNWNLDFLRISRQYGFAMSFDLLYDYQNNLKLYPLWQQYLRDNQPPLLIVWGKNDEFFPESGAAAFKKDVKNIDYNIYDTGHFALEEDGDDIIAKMRTFLDKRLN